MIPVQHAAMTATGDPILLTAILMVVGTLCIGVGLALFFERGWFG